MLVYKFSRGSSEEISKELEICILELLLSGKCNEDVPVEDWSLTWIDSSFRLIFCFLENFCIFEDGVREANLAQRALYARCLAGLPFLIVQPNSQYTALVLLVDMFIDRS
jgi:hypothetical protein